MAVVNATQQWATKRVSKTTWAALANGDSGTAESPSHLSDRSVQIKGTFGAGGTVIIEGSNDGGTTWATLRDPAGTALSFTSADIKEILENTQMVRPRVTAGDGTTSLTVLLVAASTA